MQKRSDGVWRDPEIAKHYITDMVGRIPLESVQFDLMLRLIGQERDTLGSFVDIGCGNGILSSVILSKYPRAKGMLLDFNPVMLEAARKELAAFSDGLRFERCDYADAEWIDEVGLAPASYDAVVTRFSIHHQPDERKKELYRDIYSLLSPGGIFINIEHVMSSGEWAEGVFMEYMADHLVNVEAVKDGRRTREEVEADLISRHEKDKPVVASVEDQCEWLRNLGYRDVGCHFKIFEISIFSGRK